MACTAPKDSSAPPRNPPPRLYALDGLRFVAALLVVAYHYITLRDGWGKDPEAISSSVYHLSEYGWLGVEVFFLISGFVICMSGWGRSLGDFVTSRVSRLYPAYWVAVLLTAGVLTAFPEVRSVGSWQNILTNLTMLQEGVGVADLDDVYWTLFVELKFYLLFAIVIFRGVTYRRCVLFCGLWTVAGIFSLGSHNELLTSWAVSQYSPYFIAGIAFYLMHRFRPNALLWAIVAVSFLLAQHYVHGRLVTNLGAKADAVDEWPARLVILMAFVMMGAIALGFFDRLRWSWLATAGNLTYPLYLIHMYVGFTIISLLRHHVPAWLLFPVVTAFMLAISWIIHRCVERPIGRKLRHAMKRSMKEMRADSMDYGRPCPPARAEADIRPSTDRTERRKVHVP
ncbi:acyltransferase [Streptomyces sp. DSM 41527]|uniref:Acyltransferase n=1 Tax=Streptomyces mooreae TaxID=3075523 RepID=A0ABU2T469_9ACTN|nr:acyltransferase [Streptomyces sp. DSM 41527]MDT0455009.1 acyltransferase [Streptomyces sp. DSM 41527]